jgi:hypothetical protein
MKRRSVVVLSRVAAVLTLLLGTAPRAAPAAEYSRSVPLPERVMIATQLYNSISTYYAHWQGAPEFNLDEEYRAYLGQILTSDKRDEVSLASMAFVAKLNNGHSEFLDTALTARLGQQFGFYAMPL